MCFAYDAMPPALPDGLVVASPDSVAAPELLTLTAADGASFLSAFTAAPDPHGPTVVILPDVRGLFRYYIELTSRFAQAGYHAIAIDFFGRTAGATEREEDFDWLPHITQTNPANVQADIEAAAVEATRRTGESRSVSLGFCFGGAHSFLATRNASLSLAGAVAFYGGLDGTRLGAFPSPVEHTDDMRGPILGLFAGDDPGIPPELVRRFDEGLTAAGVEHEIVTYPGVPHSFFDRTYQQHAETCDRAWIRVLRFLTDVDRATRAVPRTG